ncbi:hypothetical protein SR1949_49820 [Sphaerospermopsis reniformis]|uniref:Uncharacterized protein n=1 Tax=Sphaerospermopsis reniformis TaxID=531300 RepID=A0A480A9P0_9CYAN|nr:hypothetical protein SR1949_49820 [Sphaerospermopsis reniformis]
MVSNPNVQSTVAPQSNQVGAVMFCVTALQLIKTAKPQAIESTNCGTGNTRFAPG